MPLQAVGRVIGLQPHAEVARQADRIAKARHHPALLRHQDQILIAHELAHRRRHLRRDAGRHLRQHGAVRLLAQQPIAKITDREVRDGLKGGGIVAVDNQARHLVLFVRHQRLLQERLERQVRQRNARRHTLFGALRRHLRQIIAGTRRRSLRHQLTQIAKAIAALAHRCLIHSPPPLPRVTR